jgi:hypothetical protein
MDVVKEAKLKKFKLPNRNNWVKQKLRFSSMRWPGRSEAEKRARRARGFYECAMCHGLFKRKQYQMDHTNPVVPLNNDWPWGYIDWNVYIPNLLADPEDWQCLCLTCHEAKTIMEDEMRAYFNNLKKAIDKSNKK